MITRSMAKENQRRAATNADSTSSSTRAAQKLALEAEHARRLVEIERSLAAAERAASEKELEAQIAALSSLPYKASSSVKIGASWPSLCCTELQLGCLHARSPYHIQAHTYSEFEDHQPPLRVPSEERHGTIDSLPTVINVPKSVCFSCSLAQEPAPLRPEVAYSQRPIAAPLAQPASSTAHLSYLSGATGAPAPPRIEGVCGPAPYSCLAAGAVGDGPTSYFTLIRHSPHSLL
ncbi:hypothetical protein ACJJTC_011474 [Scirpophaga incertulas]